MSNSKLMRVVLCAVVGSAPIVATIHDGDFSTGDLKIRLAGAQARDVDHFVATEGTVVSLSVQANPGDNILALAVSSTGEMLLLIDAKPADGRAYGDFWVPVGTGGQSYKIRAASLSAEGKFSEARPVLVEVMRAIETGPRR